MCAAGTGGGQPQNCLNGTESSEVVDACSSFRFRVFQWKIRLSTMSFLCCLNKCFGNGLQWKMKCEEWGLCLTFYHPVPSDLFDSHWQIDCLPPQIHWRWHDPTIPIVPVSITESMTFDPLVDPRSTVVVASQTRHDAPQPDLCRRPCSTSFLFVFRFLFSFVMVVLTHFETITAPTPSFPPLRPARSYPGWLWKPNKL